MIVLDEIDDIKIPYYKKNAPELFEKKFPRYYPRILIKVEIPSKLIRVGPLLENFFSSTIMSFQHSDEFVRVNIKRRVRS